MSKTEVLIVGAGPTGLNLALRLASYGIDFRIVDKADGPGEASRAMAVHARTLEFYRQLGFAEEVVGQGIPATAIHLRSGGKEVAKITFGDVGTDISPYPFVLTYPQDDHERLLVGKLEAAGHHVEWNTAVSGLVQSATSVNAQLTGPNGDETCDAAYVCGADGAHSIVRHELKLEFPGGTYPNRFYVVDAELEGDFDTDGSINLGDTTFSLKLPVRSRSMHRLIGLVPPDLRDKADLGFDDIRAGVETLLAVKVKTVNWFSSYQSHHRVAGHFRVGRCFVAGDAGHVHSPAGGQGMNTGIGDAVNLAWKLAAVLRGRAKETILDTYESERIGFARKLVATTDNAFRLPTQPGMRGRLLRGFVLPHLVAPLFKIGPFRRFVFRTLSQTRISYRTTSVLSHGRAGGVSGGDRLPWVAGENIDNFASLAALDWQLHVYGELTPALRQAVKDADLSLHTFGWSDAAQRAGFQRDAAYLVRPDGYVGLVLPGQDTDALRDYSHAFGLRFAT